MLPLPPRSLPFAPCPLKCVNYVNHSRKYVTLITFITITFINE